MSLEQAALLRQAKQELYAELFKEFSIKDRETLANLFAHKCRISSLTLTDSYNSVRGTFNEATLTSADKPRVLQARNRKNEPK